MGRVLIHAGFAKTGSTSLQALFLANSARLPEGVRYLSHNDPVMRALRRRARKLAEHPADAEERALLAAARRLRKHVAPEPGETVILSSEALGGGMPTRASDEDVLAAAPRIATILEKAFRGSNPELVYYTRDRDAWLRSWHGQIRYRKHVTPEWGEWSAQPRIAAFDWTDLLDRVKSSVRGQVHELKMEDDADHRLGPGVGLAHLAGIDEAALSAWQPVPALNRGPSQRVQDLAQNPLVRRLPGPLRLRVKAWLRQRDTAS